MESSFSYKMIIFALVIMMTLPLALGVFGITKNVADGETDDVLQGYYNFTGTTPTAESVWPLTGIYTPYNGEGTYAYTKDGWLYSERVQNYTPGQYVSIGTQPAKYEVEYDHDKKLYVYKENTPDYDQNKGLGHAKGEVYTDVSFSVDQKSHIFFTEAMREQQGDYFYYAYSGYRYAFQPLADYDALVNKGSAESPVWESIPVIASQSSLSLIWYEYYSTQGISGQLVLSGSDKGVAYITSDTIIRAFNSITSTAKFPLNFNGVDMNIYIKMDPQQLSAGTSVQDCFNYGYWSIMVTSQTTDADAYASPGYGFNIENIFETVVDLMTFNTSDYGMSGWLATFASFAIIIPLYAGLITIGLDNKAVLIFAGILAAVQGIASLVSNLGF